MTFLFYYTFKGDDNLNNDIGIRISQIRKSLKLTQDKFSKRLGLARNTIATYETGVRIPMDSIIISICREFSVNEDWLRTGEGDMFAPIDVDDEYFAAATEISNDNDEFAMAAIIEYWKLDKESKKAIHNYISNVFAKYKEQE